MQGRAHDEARTPLDDMPADVRILDRLLSHLIDQETGGAWCACAGCQRDLTDLASRYAILHEGRDLLFVPVDDPRGLWLILREHHA